MFFIFLVGELAFSYFLCSSFFLTVFIFRTYFKLPNTYKYIYEYGYFGTYYRATLRLKQLVIYAGIIGFAGDYLFSRVLKMHTCRLPNTPLYAPLGHAAFGAWSSPRIGF